MERWSGVFGSLPKDHRVGKLPTRASRLPALPENLSHDQ